MINTIHLQPLAIALLLALSSWNSSAQCDYTELELETTTYQWGAEVAWELYRAEDGNNQLVASYQGTTDNTTTNQVVCLEDGCYFLLALDSWGDGWNGTTLSCSPAIPGFETAFTLNEGSYGYHTFTLGDTGCSVFLPGCTDPMAFNYIQGSTEDDGSCGYVNTFVSEVNGVSTTREFVYYAPENMDFGAPLVFVLHGYFGTAVGMHDLSGFRELAEAEGFGVVWPQGLPDGADNNHWNANFDWGSETDMEFLVQLAEHLQAEYGHSADCTYSCGYSNGGYMSYSLACRAPETFRGIGSVGGTMSNNDWETCDPSEHVPVVHLHGTNDETILYEGTDNWQWGWGQQPGVETIVAWWAEQNNCTEVEETALPNINTTDGSDVDLIRHFGGDNGYEARVYRVNGGGHDWFGSVGNMDITSAVEMWDFWRQFCEGTMDIAPTEIQEADLFALQASVLTAHAACEIMVVDVTGKTALRRPLQQGQRLDLSAYDGAYIIAGRSSAGLQTVKTVLQSH